MRNKFLNKIRKLSQLLIFSGTMNVFMLALLAYWHFKERPPTPICEKQPTYYKEHKLSVENNQLINYFCELTFEELLPYLKNTTPTDNGYSVRDFALSCLFTHHYLDISRALPMLNKSLQKCYFKYLDANKNMQQIAVHSGFSDAHFDLIEKFIQTEKWPFTPQGLFNHLKKNRSREKHLEYAFYITPEFMTVELLLKRNNASIEKEEILSLLLDGEWEMLSDFFAKQRISQDLSEEKRCSFLRNYIEKGSSIANSIFYNKSIDVCKNNLPTLKCDKISKKNITGLTVSYDCITPKNISLQKANSEKKILSGLQPWKRAYTVMEGDSLWKISRMFGVDVNELMKRNHLIKDSLQPGTMIIVP